MGRTFVRGATQFRLGVVLIKKPVGMQREKASLTHSRYAQS